jgi:hypothetical protein
MVRGSELGSENDQKRRSLAVRLSSLPDDVFLTTQNTASKTHVCSAIVSPSQAGDDKKE